MSEKTLRIVPGSLTSEEAMHHRCMGIKWMLCEGCGGELNFWGKYGDHHLGCPHALKVEPPKRRTIRERIGAAWQELVG